MRYTWDKITINRKRFVLFILIPVSTLLMNSLQVVSSSSTSSSIDLEDFVEQEGPWSRILEDWVISQNDNLTRTSKTMRLGDKMLSVTSKILPTATKRDVSETDLYLLGAIEKLVYRVDYLEKRLRRAEELLYYIIAGNKNNSKDPCLSNYTRIGQNCYHLSTREYDWKSSGSLCRGMGGHLAEFDKTEEKNDVVNYIQKDPGLRGKHYWIGGLNPGLLWIWAGSARPVQRDPIHSISGNGRCLKLSYIKEKKIVEYRGEDCGLKQRYICEMTVDDESANKIERTARALLTRSEIN